MAHRLVSALISSTVLFMTGVPALAAAPSCDPVDDLANSASQPQVATVAPGQGRVHFLKGSEARRTCPGNEAACATAAFVMPGDNVIVTSITGNYACVSFTGVSPKFSTTNGWLPVSTLSTSIAPPPPADNRIWYGDWHASYDREIQITPAQGRSRQGRWLNFSVSSTFAPGESAPSDAANAPGYQATVPPQGAAASFALDLNSGAVKPVDADPRNNQLCRAHFWRLGPYLVAADNGCDMSESMTATGIYRRAPGGQIATVPPPPAYPQPQPRVVLVPVPAPPPPPQVVVVPAQPRLSRKAAVRGCTNEVVRRNNVPGTTSNSVDGVTNVYPNGPDLIVEGFWSASRDTGYQHGSFSCDWDGQSAALRMKLIATAPPPPQPSPFVDQRPSAVDDEPVFRRPKHQQREQPEVTTAPFVDERPKQAETPEQPEVETAPMVDERPKPEDGADSGDNGDNGGGHPDFPVNRGGDSSGGDSN